MKNIILTFLVVFPFISIAQINLLNSTQDEITTSLSKINGSFKEATYTNNGVKILLYNFQLEHPMLLSAFYMNDGIHCSQCIYTYKDDSMLNEAVNSIQSNKGFEKVPDKFVYVNYNRGYYVKFIRGDDGTISIAFNPIK